MSNSATLNARSCPSLRTQRPMPRILDFLLALLSAPVVVLAINTTVTGSQLACKALSTGPLSLIVTSSGPQFQDGATSAWNLLNDELTPKCIVFPETTEHVSIAMAAIHRFKATYAVQSGGHSAMQGWNKCASPTEASLSRF
jgi:hypothetical protein